MTLFRREKNRKQHIGLIVIQSVHSAFWIYPTQQNKLEAEFSISYFINNITLGVTPHHTKEFLLVICSLNQCLNIG
jgi:hypothetical protein